MLRIEQLPIISGASRATSAVLAPGQAGCFSRHKSWRRAYGSSNATYAWDVFAGHHERLRQSG